MPSCLDSVTPIFDLFHFASSFSTKVSFLLLSLTLFCWVKYDSVLCKFVRIRGEQEEEKRTKLFENIVSLHPNMFWHKLTAPITLGDLETKKSNLSNDERICIENLRPHTSSRWFLIFAVNIKSAFFRVCSLYCVWGRGGVRRSRRWKTKEFIESCRLSS